MEQALSYRKVQGRVAAKKHHRANAPTNCSFTEVPTIGRAWWRHEGSSAPMDRREPPSLPRSPSRLGHIIAGISGQKTRSRHSLLGRTHAVATLRMGGVGQRHKDAENNLHKVTQEVAAPAGFCSSSTHKTCPIPGAA